MILLVISLCISIPQKCQNWLSVGKKHLLCDFYKLTVHAKELKDRLENMDKKMPFAAILVTTKGGKKWNVIQWGFYTNRPFYMGKILT